MDGYILHMDQDVVSCKSLLMQTRNVPRVSRSSSGRIKESDKRGGIDTIQDLLTISTVYERSRGKRRKTGKGKSWDLDAHWGRRSRAQSRAQRLVA